MYLKKQLVSVVLEVCFTCYNAHVHGEDQLCEAVLQLWSCFKPNGHPVVLNPMVRFYQQWEMIDFFTPITDVH